MKNVFQGMMRNNEIKNKIDEIKKWKEKVKRKDLKYETKNTYMTFNNMKQQDHIMVIIFILAKLIWKNLRWIKAIC